MRFLLRVLISVFSVLAIASCAWCQRAPAPVLTSAGLPTYPAIWRAAHLTGEVIARVAIKDGVVNGVEIKSGENHLQVPTIANIKTWRFEEGVNSTITVTFTYVISGDPTDDRTNPTIEVLPSLDVRITARPVKPTVNYSR